jgi:ferrous iron transport protein B
MLFIPCAATVSVIKQEIESRKWFLFTLIFMLLISLGSGMAAYRLALLFGI